MHKWEYAYIEWDRNPANMYRYIMRVYVDAGGGKSEVVQKKVLRSEPDFRQQLNNWVYQFGQEGYEMAGVTGTSVGSVDQTYTYWFKRPIP